MDIKLVIKEPEFAGLMANSSKMKIDAFEDYTKSRGFGIENKFKRINIDKVISNTTMYDACYQAYSDALKNFYNLYTAHSSEFSSSLEFAESLFESLKNLVVVQNVLPSNNNTPKRVLNATEVKFYEDKREEYIRNIMTQAVPSVGVVSALEVLENAKVEEIADFVDQIEGEVSKIIAGNSWDPNNQDHRTAALHEYLVCYLPGTFRMGDNISTKKIDINKTRFSGADAKYKDTPEYLQVLAFLENYIFAEKNGMIANGTAFDGFRFFDISTGKTCRVNTQNLHKTKLAAADRYLQSNFVLDEEFAQALLTMPKRFVKVSNLNYIKTTSVVDGDTIETIKTMYRKKYKTKDFDRDYWFDENLEMGNFCKVKEYNKTKGTYSFSLYYFPDNEAQCAIQLFRIDKVEDLFKGAPASHNLRGKEKIENTLHAHTYNQIDAVLKNYNKDESLGKMDLSHIFPVANGLDRKVVEEFFDCFCGIHGKHLQKVNQRRFAKFFQKYQPVEWSLS